MFDFGASAHWFTLHTQRLVPRGLFVFFVQAATSIVQLIFGQANLRPVDQDLEFIQAGSCFLTGHVQVPGRMWKEKGQGAVLFLKRMGITNTPSSILNEFHIFIFELLYTSDFHDCLCQGTG